MSLNALRQVTVSHKGNLGGKALVKCVFCLFGSHQFLMVTTQIGSKSVIFDSQSQVLRCPISGCFDLMSTRLLESPAAKSDGFIY